MAQLTYNDVLQFLGLSNWQFIAIAIFLLLAWSIGAMLWKIGALKKVNVDKTIMPAFKCIYISYLGSYDDISAIYNQSISDFQLVFKFSSYFAIFYDNPNEQEEGALSKAVIGVALTQGEESKVSLFLSKFPQYKRGEFPSSQCLRVEYPLVGSLSSILVIGTVYPVIQKKIQELGLKLQRKQIIEIYHSNEMMSVVVPIQNQDSFQKWYEPTDYSRLDRKKQL